MKEEDEQLELADQGTQHIEASPQIFNGPETEKEWASVMEQIARTESQNAVNQL